MSSEEKQEQLSAYNDSDIKLSQKDIARLRQIGSAAKYLIRTIRDCDDIPGDDVPWEVAAFAASLLISRGEKIYYPMLWPNAANGISWGDSYFHVITDELLRRIQQ